MTHRSRDKGPAKVGGVTSSLTGWLAQCEATVASFQEVAAFESQMLFTSRGKPPSFPPDRLASVEKRENLLTNQFSKRSVSPGSHTPQAGYWAPHTDIEVLKS